MPQLNVYLDKKTMEKVKDAAGMENSSVSKWVRTKLDHALKGDWPEGYFEVFGSLADVDLKRPDQGKLADDSKRETL